MTILSSIKTQVVLTRLRLTGVLCCTLLLQPLCLGKEDSQVSGSTETEVLSEDSPLADEDISPGAVIREDDTTHKSFAPLIPLDAPKWVRSTSPKQGEFNLSFPILTTSEKPDVNDVRQLRASCVSEIIHALDESGYFAVPADEILLAKWGKGYRDRVYEDWCTRKPETFESTTPIGGTVLFHHWQLVTIPESHYRDLKDIEKKILTHHDRLTFAGYGILSILAISSGAGGFSVLMRRRRN